MQNDGNYGDALIRYGTLKFFEDHKFRCKELDMASYADKAACLLTGVIDRLADRHLFVYSGSGGWAAACRSGFENVRRQRRATPNIFVLPTTFENQELDFDFPVYARDRFESMNFLQNGLFCHDMAFYLALIEPGRVLPDRLPPKSRLGVLLRTDNESCGWNQKTQLNRPGDISTLGNHRSDPQQFLRIIDQFEEIVTDRLHVAIGAAILGKTVRMICGNYFKSRAIYDSSMKGIFERVELLANPEAYLRACVVGNI